MTETNRFESAACVNTISSERHMWPYVMTIGLYFNCTNMCHFCSKSRVNCVNFCIFLPFFKTISSKYGLFFIFSFHLRKSKLSKVTCLNWIFDHVLTKTDRYTYICIYQKAGLFHPNYQFNNAKNIKSGTQLCVTNL